MKFEITLTGDEIIQAVQQYLSSRLGMDGVEIPDMPDNMPDELIFEVKSKSWKTVEIP